MEHIDVTIEGNRAVGKTTLAFFLRCVLDELGANVDYIHEGMDPQRLAHYIKQNARPKDIDFSRWNINIIDTLSTETYPEYLARIKKE